MIVIASIGSGKLSLCKIRRTLLQIGFAERDAHSGRFRFVGYGFIRGKVENSVSGGIYE